MRHVVWALGFATSLLAAGCGVSKDTDKVASSKQSSTQLTNAPVTAASCQIATLTSTRSGKQKAASCPSQPSKSASQHRLDKQRKYLEAWTKAAGAWKGLSAKEREHRRSQLKRSIMGGGVQ